MRADCISLLLGLIALHACRVQAGDWPQWLGPARNGICAEVMATNWPVSGPAVAWQQQVGRGFSGLAVQNNRLIVFHRLGDKETVDCLEAANGTSIWRFEYPTAYKDDFGFDPGPRATPALTDDKVFTFGAEGALHGLDLGTGKKLWGVDTKEKFNAPKGFFGMACSPLVVGGKVLLNIGGPDGAGIVAFDVDNGQVLWKATDDEASYSSPVAAILDGKLRALFLTRSRFLAIDPESGKVQLELPWRARAHASVNAATPLVIGDLIFLSTSYGTGAGVFKVKRDTLQKVWASDDALSSHYATSVHREGFLYGFHGRQEYGPSLRCVEVQSGRVRWSQENFGAGSILMAKDKLVVLKEDGQLLLLEASPKGYRELQRAQILPSEVRAFPAIAGGFLFARSKEKLVCVHIGQGQPQP